MKAKYRKKLKADGELMKGAEHQCPLCYGYGYVYDWRLTGPQVCQGCDGTGFLNAGRRNG